MITLPDLRLRLTADIPIFARNWRNDPAIRRWCREHTEISATRHQYWLDRIEKDPTIKMFGIETAEGQEVGVCGLTSINYVNQSAEFSLYIQPKEQSKGYGGEALGILIHHGFTALNLNRIWGEVFDGNPSLPIFEALGFRREGRLRQSYFRDGRFIDSHIIGLLRGDWCLSKSSYPS